MHEHSEVSWAELSELSGVSEAELRDWMNEGILISLDLQSPQWTFGADRLVTVRLACRLRKGLELEPNGVALIPMLLT